MISGLTMAAVAVIVGLWLTFFRDTDEKLLNLNVGDSIGYDIDYQSDANVVGGFFSEKFKAKKIATSLKGTLALKVVEFSDKGYKVFGRILSKKYISGTGSASPKKVDWQFYFRWTENGLIEYIDLNEADLAEHVYVIADILDQLNFEYKDKEKWSVKEEKNYGEISADYEKEYDIFGVKVSKNVNEKNSRVEIFSNTILNVRWFSFPHALKSDRRRKFFSNQGEISSDTLAFSLVESKSEIVDDQIEKINLSTENLFRDNLRLEKLSDLARQEKVKKRLSDLSPLALQQAIEISKLNQQALIDLGFILAAYLEFSPDTIKDVVLNDLQLYSWNDPRFDLYIQNLRYVGNLGSQEILMEAIAAQNEFRKKAQLMIALGLIDKPSSSSFQFMEKLSASSDVKVSEQAELMLGSMVDLSDIKFSTSAVRAKKSLEEKLSAAQTLPDKLHYLDAVGNMGKNASVNSLNDFLDSEQAEVRKEAIDSLRLIENEESAPIFIKLMADEDVAIRRAALEALSYQVGNSKVYQSLLNRLLMENNAEVMKLVITNLAQFNQYRGQTKMALNNFISRCGVTELCNYAKTVSAGL